jgi:hypothetical protein
MDSQYYEESLYRLQNEVLNALNNYGDTVFSNRRYRAEPEQAWQASLP